MNISQRKYLIFILTLALIFLSACEFGTSPIISETWTLIKLLATSERVDEVVEIVEVHNCEIPEPKETVCSAGTSNDLSISGGGSSDELEVLKVKFSLSAEVSSGLGIGRDSGESMSLELPPKGSIYTYKIKKVYKVLGGEALASSTVGKEEKVTYNFHSSCTIHPIERQLTSCQPNNPVTSEPTQQVMSPTQAPSSQTIKLTSADYGKLLYEENFDKDNEAWQLKKASVIRDGKLLMDANTDTNIFPDKQFSDFIFESSYRTVDPNATEGGLAVLLRFQIPPCSGWNCSLQIWSAFGDKGKSWEWRTAGARRLVGQDISRLSGDIPAPSTDPSGWNKLTVIVKGDEYKVFVNSEYVYTYTDSTFTSGSFVLQGSTVPIYIDYVRVYSLP